MVQLPIAPRVGPDCSDVVCWEDFMLVSFPMDDATEKRSNFSYGTSERARHEALFGTGNIPGKIPRIREWHEGFSALGKFPGKMPFFQSATVVHITLVMLALAFLVSSACAARQLA